METFTTENDTPEMENLARLAENLVYQLPGCSDVMVRKTIQEVYRDFCRRSCCLRVRRRFTISSDDEFVSAAPIFGGVVECVAGVSLNGRPLDPRRWSAEGGRVWLAECVRPTNDNTAEVETLSVEIPALGSEEVPQGFIQRHGDAICAGVIARLRSMQNRAWTDAQQAGEATLRYNNAASEERTRYYAGNSRGDLGHGIDFSGLV